jgi:uncharacterized protein involved in response to NO
MSPIPRVPRGLSGPALFSYGFRPFFLFGAAWAAAAVALWLPLLFGDIRLPTAFSPIDWHVHEMLYGYLAAVVAGFLLTAIPNWTGRFPLAGTPLVLLVLLWCAGRVAVLLSADLGPVLVAAIDCGFLVVFAAVCMREIVAGKNWGNLRVVAVLAVLAAGNILFHVEVTMRGAATYGGRVGIAAAIAMIMVMGGRIVPSFTRNWLVRENPGRLPQPIATFDVAAIAVSIAAFALWVLLPAVVVTGAALAIAGALQVVRLARWAGDRTWRDPLVLILHVGYAFVPVGFLLLAASVFWPHVIPMSAGVHAFTAGAIGTMTLAVMTRATLGHTGHPLAATAGTQVIYGLVVVAALARIAASMVPSPFALLHIAAVAWIAAFGLFALIYGPMLLRPRRR